MLTNCLVRKSEQTHACCVEILFTDPWRIYKNKSINSPWNNREAVREISWYICMWLCYYNIEGKLWLLTILTLTFFYCVCYYILEDSQFESYCPTHQSYFFDVFWWAPVKHPCRVIPLHAHVHALDLFISRNLKGVVSTGKKGQYIYVRPFC